MYGLEPTWFFDLGSLSVIKLKKIKVPVSFLVFKIIEKKVLVSILVNNGFLKVLPNFLFFFLKKKEGK